MSETPGEYRASSNTDPYSDDFPTTMQSQDYESQVEQILQIYQEILQEIRMMRWLIQQWLEGSHE